MEAVSTQQLTLTRLWYLIGEWEGTGKGPDFRFRASAHYSWALGDHFIAGQLTLSDLLSGELRAAEHVYYYYDNGLNCLVSDVFSLDGMTEHSLGHADARGRMVLTTDRLDCVPRGSTVCRLRRTVWTMAASQWAFAVEKDCGQGFAPYLEGQMRHRG